MQIVEEEDEHKFGFDLLDPTKLMPEELVPVAPDRQDDAEPQPATTSSPRPSRSPSTVGNVVPGIDFTNDPLLQGRLFSYLDTQLSRLGGPNFARDPDQPPDRAGAQQPARRPHAPDHQHRPGQLPPELARRRLPDAGRRRARRLRAAIPERLDGPKVRERSESFFDHFSQATLFWNSLSPPERQHLIDACRFELGKVTRKEVRTRVLFGLFAEIDPDLAASVSAAIGVPVPYRRVPAPAGTAEPNHRGDNGGLERAPSLSLENQPKNSIRTRKVAMLVGAGFDSRDATAVRNR